MKKSSIKFWIVLIIFLLAVGVTFVGVFLNNILIVLIGIALMAIIYGYSKLK